MDSNGRIAGSYRKIKLLPFREYVPLEGYFPWPNWFVPKGGNYIPGSEYSLFFLGEHRFGVVICWENVYSGLFREFVQGGAQFMFNLTNEAALESPTASRQLLSMSVFRAVENKIALLRCANTGISAMIEPTGHIRSKVVDSAGVDTFVSGVLTDYVPVSSGKRTFYTRYGNVFGIMNIILTGFMILHLLFQYVMATLIGIRIARKNSLIGE